MPSHTWVEVARLNTELLRNQPSAWTEAESWLRKAIEEMGHTPEVIDMLAYRSIGYSVEAPEALGAAYDTKPLA